jgi:cardiolipin hydrolase
MYDSNKDLT